MEAPEAYQILGVTPDIADDALVRAYRDLVKVWHPDRFGHDEALRAKANEKLSEINRAYRVIKQLREEARFTSGSSGAPQSDPVPEPEPAPAAEPPPSASAGAPTSRRFAAVAMMVVFLVALGAGVVWWSRRVPTPVPARLPERGKLIVNSVRFSADDFVVDLWHNGKLVPYAKREMKYERFGATGEHVNLEIREGDWLVFNVVNNRMRWGGAHYFGVVGVHDGDSVVFTSDVNDGRWTYTDVTGEVQQFISNRDFRGKPVARPAQPWAEGDAFMKSMAKGKWNGDSIWGGGRNTWIKFVALPATNKPPGGATGD